MFGAINGMMLDMLAAVARKDYDDRRRRQAQGILKAKANGKYRGRPESADPNAGIGAMLRGGASWSIHPEGDGLQPRDGREDSAPERNGSGGVKTTRGWSIFA